MAGNRDTVLLETVKTHRARLLSAFLYGEMTERRLGQDNVKRLLGSIVLAAVVCSGCVGFALVTSILADQAAARRAAQQSQGPVAPGISDQPYAADYFDRTTRRGWGDAELGGRWQTSGSTRAYAVRDGAGTLDVPVGGFRLATLDVNREAADVTTSVELDELASRVTVIGRKVEEDDYRLVVALTSDEQVTVALMSRQDRTMVPLSNTVGLLGAYQPGDAISIRFQVYGVRPALLRAKVWRGGEPEPEAWTVSGQDGFEPLQRGGAVGVGASRPDSSKRPLQVEVHDLVARPVFR
jgi:hypothetical protein